MHQKLFWLLMAQNAACFPEQFKVFLLTTCLHHYLLNNLVPKKYRFGSSLNYPRCQIHRYRLMRSACVKNKIEMPVCSGLRLSLLELTNVDYLLKEFWKSDRFKYETPFSVMENNQNVSTPQFPSAETWNESYHTGLQQSLEGIYAKQ